MATIAPIIPSPISGPGAATGTAMADQEVRQAMRVRDSVRKNDCKTQLHEIRIDLSRILKTINLSVNPIFEEMPSNNRGLHAPKVPFSAARTPLINGKIAAREVDKR